VASINIIYRDNGLGLSRDFRLLAEALRSNGCDVAATPLTHSDERWRRKKRGRWVARSKQWLRRVTAQHPPKRFDANVMLEHLWPEHLGSASRNVALPNPEWFDRHDMHFLRDIDTVWAKTQNGVHIYKRLNCATHYVGFASDDRYDPATPRERTFLHLAGGSRTKATRHTMNVWAAHPEWPMLTVLQDPSEATAAPTAANITHRIGYLNSAKQDEYAQLRNLQNGHLFHLCLSETDAWGHYLVEALGVGAVTLTTDAPPMNELITPDRGLLVPYASSGRMSLATTYQFDDKQFVASVEQVLSLSDTELRKISARAREWFQENQRTFVSRVGGAVQAALA
jgi:glycosyltransferase involved in cell wall biosynthesis